MYGRQHSGQASAHVSSKTMQRCMLAAQYADSHTLNVPLMNRMTTSPYMWTTAFHWQLCCPESCLDDGTGDAAGVWRPRYPHQVLP